MRLFPWKVYLTLMSRKEIDQLLTRSIGKVLIKNEKKISMTFVRDVIFEKMFGDAL